MALRSWLRRVRTYARADADLAAEIDFHLQARIDHWRGQGLTLADARRRARIEFGGIEHYKDECREHVGLRLLRELITDLRYGARRLLAAPLFTAISIAVLAIAIGANTAVFSVLETVMLNMLPVHRPQDLRELAWVQPGDSKWEMSYDGSQRPYPGGGLIATSFSYPVYAHVRDHTSVFSDLLLFTSADLTVAAAGRDQRASGLLVSGNFLSGLGVNMAFGRSIAPDDDRTGAPAVAVVSWAFWQRAFGGDPGALGQPITVNGVDASIVGITPASFFGVEPGTTSDLFVPVSRFIASTDDKGDRRNDPHFWAFRVMGRVRSGMADERVADETDALARQALPPDYANAPSGMTRVVIRPGGQGLDSLRRNYARPLYLLLAIMTLVLLIGCGSIASLLITRTAARAREIRIRLALGAGRRRVIRQLLTESLLLAAISGVAGVGIAMILRGGVLPVINQENEPLSIALGVDVRLVLFAMGLCVGVGLLCGILPAWRAARQTALVSTGAVTEGAVGPSRLFAGRTLIVIQVTISMVLLAAAGLFVRTIVNLRSQALGFRPDHVLLLQLDATASGYEDARLNDFYGRVLERLRALPGVQAASMSRYALLAGGATRESVTAAEEPQKTIDVHVHFVSPGHFATMGIPVMGGRDVSEQDREGAPRVAVVNESLARLLPGGGTPIGRRLRYDGPDANVEIVGMAGDARFASLREPAPPTVYLPYRQYQQHRMTFAVRTAADPALLAEPARHAVEVVDPRVPVYEIRTEEDQIDRATRQERLFALVASGFAAVALFVACVSIYGTLAYGVARRTAEIGLRMALGASRAGIATMVIRDSIAPVLVGVVAGIGAAVITAKSLESMLYGLSPADPLTLAAAGASLLGSALLAAWIPSRRASKVQPVAALRME